MKIKIHMSFENDKGISEQSFETVFNSKEHLFMNAQRVSTILTAMLESGILGLLGEKFLDAKNEKEERQKLSSDVSTAETIDAVAGQSPYGFRKPV